MDDPKAEHRSAASTAGLRSYWLPAVALFLLTVFLYIPSMTNGFIWDDTEYVVNNPTLKSADGLWRIWTEPTSIPQYYPLVHTTFWIEARLWGTDSAPGYHIDNILLHALAVVLLWRALLVIGAPWPLLCAAIFAAHPVMVESVAWVTERKNVLSITFYLLAFHAYFRSGYLDMSEESDVAPRAGSCLSRNWYVASLAFFLFALLSKTVTCSLPAAILLIVWWKRGTLRRRDLRPLLPMFVIGLVLSLVTSHLEATFVGARGPDFDWSPVDRVLIAGHALCFYAWKLVWPHPLMFMYPRWDLHADQARQFLYPVMAAAAVFGLWIARRWIGRGPLVAVLFFAGTLAPALGFVNVYPMRYSFVADHFQYLASIGVIVLIVACLDWIFRRGTGVRWLQLIPAVIVLAPLGVLTWRQQSIYRDRKTLWTKTIEQNETCWMAHLNLASAYKEQRNFDAALKETKRGLELAPNEADTNYDYGVALALRNKWPDAAAQFQRAIDCDNQCAQAWSDLAVILWEQGADTPEVKAKALRDAREALKINPRQDRAHYVLGRFDEYRNDLPAAIVEYKIVLSLNDKDFHTRELLGNCLMETGQYGNAAGVFTQLVRHNPRDAFAMTNLGTACLKAGHFEEAANWFRQALAVDRNQSQARENLAAMQRTTAQ